MIAIAILLILAGLLIPAVGIFQRQAARAATQAMLAKITAGVAAYTVDKALMPGQGMPPICMVDGGGPLTTFTANQWNAVRGVGITLYRELVSVELETRNRLRPGYLAREFTTSQIETQPSPHLIDRWGNPIIYLAWTGGRDAGGRAIWPKRGSGDLAPGGYRLDGNNQGTECWSAGPDGAFGTLRSLVGDDADSIPDPVTATLVPR